MKTIIVKWHDSVNDSRYTLHKTERVIASDVILAIDCLGDPSRTSYRFVPKADVPDVDFGGIDENYYDNKKDEPMLETLWDSLTSKVHYNYF